MTPMAFELISGTPRWRAVNGVGQILEGTVERILRQRQRGVVDLEL